ncbi:MAG: VanZ family protein [Eubacteriales bacterium]
MLNEYLGVGISFFIQYIPLALIIFCAFTVIKFLIKRKVEFKFLIMLCEILWITTVLVILKITGITVENIKLIFLFDGNVNCSFNLIGDGVSMATFLNVIMFIPLGFLTPIIFPRLQKKWLYTILLGFIFSISIELIQIFVGRFVQLNDVLMNTLGVFIGYEIWYFLLKRRNKQYD